MIRSALRACVAVLLVAACTSAPDEAPAPPPGETPAATMGGGLGPDSGIASAEIEGAPEPGTQEELEVAVGDRVFFDYDSAVLSPLATETLDRQAAWLKQYPDLIVTVEGHADERGTREYNLALGDRRASAVKNYLVALDIDPERLLTISYGEERPANPASNEEAWAENRRAVTVVSTVY